MALSPRLKGCAMLDELPAWKKELILRKRANTRVHGDLSITSVAYIDNTAGSIKYNPPQTEDSSYPGQRSIWGHQLSPQCSVWGAGNSASFASVEKIQIVQSAFEFGGSREVVNSAASDSESLRGDVCKLDDKYNVDKYIPSGERKATAMHHKGLIGRHTGRSSSMVFSGDCDQEEFQYGPGIVSRLKDRYLSLAMREAKCRASLRRYSSLEDLLDDPPVHQRGRSSQKIIPAAGGPQPSRKELMKRTRSVDSLSYRKSYEPQMPKSVSSGGIKNSSKNVCPASLPNDNENTDIRIVTAEKIALCRKPSPPQTILGEDELPQLDTVRHTKQIFESGTSGPRVARGTASKVAAYKASQGINNRPAKPAIKAKPPQLMARKSPLTPALENVRNSLKQVPAVGKPAPRSNLSARSIPGVNENVSPSHKKNFSAGLTPVTASVTAPLVNGDYKLIGKPDKPFQKASSNFISNLRNDCQDFDHTDRGISSFNSKGRPLSPIPTNLPPSPPSSHKIVNSNAIDCDHENRKEMERVIHENKKNMEKHLAAVASKANDIASIPSKIVNDTCKNAPASLPTPKTEPLSDTNTYFKSSDPVVSNGQTQPVNGISAAPSMKPKTKIREAQNTSVMFDFTKRNDTPNYIENDGLDMSKRKAMPYNESSGYVIMPGYDGRQDSSTDGEDLEDELTEHRTSSTLSPCNIVFDGEGVIINGRSNLQRQPRSKKLEISFNMTSTSIHEYPSEASILLDYEDKIEDMNGAPFQGGLACYTPSNLQLAESFHLGVSKPLLMHPPTPPKERPPADNSILNHLRPADESETITWSSDNAPDLLF